jgi:triacylglycerol lipase
MLARLQQLVVSILIASSAGWALYFSARGWLIAAGGAILAIAGYLAVIALEFWLLSRTVSPSDPKRATFRQMASAWWQEVLAAPQVFLWRQPFRSGAISDRLAAMIPPRRAVVLVHGFFCNRGLWNPWMDRLLEAGVPFAALTLEPVFGSIDAYTVDIDVAVRRARSATGLAPVLVAHSMGGLAVRAWLARVGKGAEIHRVVTIGSPHRGTALAHHSHTPNTRQMRIGSAWLDQLERAESPDAHCAFTCFWSRCDNIVFPTETATLAGADNRHLEATPHVRMAYHPQVMAEVLRLVEMEAAGAV